MAKKSAKKAFKKTATKSPPIIKVPSPAGFDLCPLGEAYWRRLAPQLVAINVLTELHLETFAELCRTYGEYRTLTKWLLEDPSRAMFTSESGYESESPQVRMREKALANLQKLWPKFGLHPYSLAQMRKHGGISSAKSSALHEFNKRRASR